MDSISGFDYYDCRSVGLEMNVSVNPIWRELKLKCPCPYLDRDLFIIKENMYKNDMDFVIINEGREGSGKTNLALYQAWSLNPDFDFKTAYYTSDGFFKAAPDLYKQVILYDEGGEMLNKRLWATERNVDLNRVLMTYRYKNNCIIVNIPDYLMIDPGVRGGRVAAVFTTKFNMDKETLLFRRGQFNAYSAKAAGLIRKQWPTGKKVYPRASYSGYIPSMKRIVPHIWEDYMKVQKKKDDILTGIRDKYQRREDEELNKREKLERLSANGSVV